MIRDIYLKGHNKILSKFREEEKTKLGKLRGGNSGGLTEDGRLLSSCAAKTYLRFKGIDLSSLEFNQLEFKGNTEETVMERELMFEAGRANEDLWYNVIKEGYDGPILREEEIPTKWLTDNGIAVTGRPDLVLIDKYNEKPMLGIELKLVSSLWTARDVLFKKEPKLAHLLQASHYAWQLGVPFEIWYTSRADYHIGQMSNLFPKIDDKDSQFIQYAYYKYGNINPKTNKRIKHRSTSEEYAQLNDKDRVREPLKVLPFIQGYKVKIKENGDIYYCDAMEKYEFWHKTILNVEMIKDFYNFVSEMDNYGKVPKEPELLTVKGEKLNYKLSKYCALADKGLCCGQCAGKDLNKWTEDVKQLVNKEG